MTSAEANQKKCPYCAEVIHGDAIKCRYCGSWLDKHRYMIGWTRSVKHKRIAGVCAGLAKQLNISVTLIRLAFVITAFWFWGIVIYVALWLLMPEDESEK